MINQEKRKKNSFARDIAIKSMNFVGLKFVYYGDIQIKLKVQN